jgi:hypothetical protein
VSQYNIRQPSRHIPYPGYRCEYQSAPLLLHLFPLLHTSATTACLSHRPQLAATRCLQISQDAPSGGRVPMRLSLLDEHRYLTLCLLLSFRSDKKCKAKRIFEGARNICAQQGTDSDGPTPTAPSSGKPTIDGSPMTAFEPGSDLHRAQCACLHLQGEARPVTISIYP